MFTPTLRCVLGTVSGCSSGDTALTDRMTIEACMESWGPSIQSQLMMPQLELGLAIRLT